MLLLFYMMVYCTAWAIEECYKKLTNFLYYAKSIL